MCKCIYFAVSLRFISLVLAFGSIRVFTIFMRNTRTFCFVCRIFFLSLFYFVPCTFCSTHFKSLRTYVPVVTWILIRRFPFRRIVVYVCDEHERERGRKRDTVWCALLEVFGFHQHKCRLFRTFTSLCYGKKCTRRFFYVDYWLHKNWMYSGDKKGEKPNKNWTDTRQRQKSKLGDERFFRGNCVGKQDSLLHHLLSAFLPVLYVCVCVFYFGRLILC